MLVVQIALSSHWGRVRYFEPYEIYDPLSTWSTTSCSGPRCCSFLRWDWWAT